MEITNMEGKRVSKEIIVRDCLYVDIITKSIVAFIYTPKGIKRVCMDNVYKLKKE